jgi:hypothetical protein
MSSREDLHSVWFLQPDFFKSRLKQGGSKAWHVEDGGYTQDRIDTGKVNHMLRQPAYQSVDSSPV